MPAIKLDGSKKILVCTAERVGDTLFCTPAIRLLKQNLPDVQIDVLAFSNLARDILLRNPNVSQIHVSNSSFVIRNIMKDYAMAVNLFFEMEKVFGKLPKNLVRIHKPEITIHRTQQIYDFARSLLTTPQDVPLHYDIFSENKDKETLAKTLIQENVNIETDILVGCQLGCHRVARRGWKFWDRNRHQHKKVWPLENYVELAERLTQFEPRIRFVLTGSPSERYIANMFLDRFPQAIDLIGKTSLHQLTSLMDFLSVLVTHDTGTMHIACAKQLPQVTLFGPTPVAFTGPFPHASQYSILRENSMSEISVSRVFEETVKRLSVNF